MENSNHSFKIDNHFKVVFTKISSHSSIEKIGILFPDIKPQNVISAALHSEISSGHKLYSHLLQLIKKIEKISSHRGVRATDEVIALIAAIYHDFPKLVENGYFEDPLLLKIIDHGIGHSISAQKLFYYLDEPEVANAIRHNSTDFAIDLSNSEVTVPELLLNLAEKTDNLGQDISVWEKYESIKKKIGAHPEFDDFSERLVCKYLDRVNSEKRVLYDYEFITDKNAPIKEVLIVQRFDGKYCAPIGKYRDTNSNIKMAEYFSRWGFNTTILHEGEFKIDLFEGHVKVIGCDKESIDQLLPIYCFKKDIIVVEGSTSRLSNLRKRLSSGSGLVLMLRTLADGQMTKERIEKALCADQIWVMTEEMKQVVNKQFKDNKVIKFPEIRILQSGVDQDLFCINPEIPRIPGKITYLGAITKIKGVDILLDAFKIVQKKFHYAELHLLGDPDIYGRVNEFDMSYVKRMKGVYTHGALLAQEIVPHLQSAHLSVLITQIYETFGKSAQQARSCGARMVVSNMGALPFHVQSEEEGIVLNTVNKDTVADAIINILSTLPKTVAPPKDRYHSWKKTAADFTSNYIYLTRKAFQRIISE